MPKDIIFTKSKREAVQPLIEKHISINRTIEYMKDQIITASTAEKAIDILLKQFGKDYTYFIFHAVKETFQTSAARISSLL